MIRGVQLRGELIRSLRLARGWSQLDLAERAGVGERTIRNAEYGRIIEGSTASYIAGALDVAMDLLVKPTPHASNQFILPHFERAFRDAFFNGLTAPLQQMLAPNCIWRIVGFPRTDSLKLVSNREDLGELFASVRSEAIWGESQAWKVNCEEACVLSGSFFLVRNYTSHDSAAIRFHCNLVGRLEQELCSNVTQTLDVDSRER